MNIKEVSLRLKTLVRKFFSPKIINLIKKITNVRQKNEVDIIYSLFEKKIKTKVMLDVGAHYGESLSSFLFEGWEIYAFEPDKKNMNILKILSNGNAKLNLDNRGCSNESLHDVNFYKSDISTGISSMSSFDQSHKKAEKISTVSIRDFIKEKNILEIGFLKIDTEGHDLFVLQGVPWESLKPEFILAEFEDRKTKKLGYDYHDMANLLLKNGYAVYVSEWFPIEKYGEAHSWRNFSRYPYHLKDKNGWGNLIAFTNHSLIDQIESTRLLK